MWILSQSTLQKTLSDHATSLVKLTLGVFCFGTIRRRVRVGWIERHPRSAGETRPPSRQALARELEVQMIRVGGRQPSRVKRPPDTEAEIECMIVGGKPETKGRSEARRSAEPGTAAKDTIVAIALRYPGGTVLGCPFVVGVQTILDPLPDVAVHVVKAELVGRK